MKYTTIAVADDPGACSITVSSMSDSISIRGYKQSDTLEVTFTWTSVPDAVTIISGRLEARANPTDSFSDDVIDENGTVVLDGSSGTATVTFLVDLTQTVAEITYVLLISLIDSNSRPRTWRGFLRTEFGA